ncbi:MAG: ZIP family metal transporter [Candidatus Omnitrophica bacterium]|nr:ZIP family metal transporter [Candidatus Omnitrophota bacterium]
MNFIFAVIASIIVSLISLIGIVSLLLKEKLLNKLLILLIGFSAGGLIGGAFLHLIPESLEFYKDATHLFLYVILGFLIFFFMEKYFYWRHCHEGHCNIHAFTYLNLIGDGIHNFLDGIIIGTSFATSLELGIASTLAIVMHEIPQEIGDFGVLIYGGFSKMKALTFNFLSALTAVAGTMAGYYFSSRVSGFSNALLPIAAGGFIYIAACDLIPEMHKEINKTKSVFSVLAFILGIGLMYLVKAGCCH